MPTRWLIVLAYAGLIFFLSSRPATSYPKVDIPFADKIVHSCEYAGLGFLLARALRRKSEPKTAWQRVALVTLLGGLYGVGDEYHQSFVPYRNGNDPGDVAADVVGSALGALVHRRLLTADRFRRLT